MVQKRKEEIVRRFAENDVLLTSHAFERIITHCLDVDKVIVCAKEKNQWLISNEFLAEFVSEGYATPGLSPVSVYQPPTIGPQITVPEPVQAPLPDTWNAGIDLIAPKEIRELDKVVVSRPVRRILAKELPSGLNILKDSDVTDKSTCEGKLEDFIGYFNERYESLRDIVRNRDSFLGAVPIEIVKKHRGEVSSCVVMVKEKRESKKGFRFLEVEDPTGELTVMIPKDNDALNALYARVLADEVIGLQGKLANDFFIASEIVEPELPINHKANYSEEPVCAVLISDIHVGSNLFLEKEFNNFIDWLSFKGDNDDVVDKIKYILVAGDLVDGIGIYPGQEKELTIPDIFKQYDFLATLLEKVPDYIEIVLAMGNHDAVRKAEPQPMLAKDIGGRLFDLDNVHVTGNPVGLTLNTVKFLLYHGTSMDTMIGNLSGCSYSRPETTMIEYLKKRHLAPMYGNDSLSPDRKDYMVIRDIPDVFHAGHVHTNGYANYRGVRVINSGTWQGRTKYQEELGHMPTPARVPIINLQTHEVSVKHFGE